MQFLYDSKTTGNRRKAKIIPIQSKMVLSHTIILTTRFSETDAMQIVWHGNFLKYFEDGREAFGKKYGIKYLDIYALGFSVPIVHLEVDYKRPASFNQEIRVEISFADTQAAKMVFHYKVFNNDTNEVLCTGKTVQVFIDRGGELQLTNPEFFIKWKEEHGIK